jgi:hypothetical protein
MENLALNQKIKVILLWIGGLILAIGAGSSIGSADYKPLVLGGLLAAVIIIWFFTGRYFWVLTIASSFLAGTFPILGGAFTPFQLLMLIGVAKFLIENIVLSRKRLQVGNRFDLLLIAGFMGVLTLHALRDRFGMRFLGSSTWGGHNYVNVYVGLAAFFVIQSIHMSPRVWAKLPYIVLAVSAFDLFIAVITTIFPSLIYHIYPFYSAVSTLGVEEILTGESNVTGRIGAFGSFGYLLVILVLAATQLNEILNPRNLFRLLCLLGGFLSIMFSGFRSALINAMIGFLAAGVRDLKFRMLALLPLFALILFGLSLVNSQIVHLPKQIQRVLSFVPGDWDPEMARDAAGSNEFRAQVWNLWMRDYFPARPLLGRGFSFRSDWAQASISKRNSIDYEQTVEVQNLHNGFFAALDTFGIVGTLFFVIWVVRMLARTVRVSFQKNQEGGMTLRFLALYLTVWIIAYWFGAQTIGSFLPLQFALSAVFLRLKETIDATAPHAPVEAPAVESFRKNLATA